MQLSIRLIAHPRPGAWLRPVIVLVVVIVTAVLVIRSGCSPAEVLALILGAGVAGTQAAPTLLGGLAGGGAQW